MKKLVKWVIGVPVLGLLLMLMTARNAAAQDVTVSYQSFYDNLSPYGQWVSDPQYGNVFVPNEGGDFRPYYSGGHWAMTEYGNTWVSDQPYGWATYHYGRWTYNPYYGWVWVPGYQWAPAWVSWRNGGGNCGWAPMAPGVNIGVSYGYPDSWWVFVGTQYLYRPNYSSYWRGPGYNHQYVNQTTYINNTYVDNSTHVTYNYGPRASVVQQATHQPVQVLRVNRAATPGATTVRGNSVNIYRPVVNKATATTARPTNVIRATQPIGKPQAVVANRQPEFRQVVQKQAAQQPRAGQVQAGQRANVAGAGRNVPAPQPARGQAQPQVNRAQPQVNRVQPQVNRAVPQVNRAVPIQPQVNRAVPTQPQVNRTQPQVNRAQPQMAQPQVNRAQPQMNRPQPQMAQPQQRSQPQPQMNRPQPQIAQPQQRAQPQPQMNRPQPQMAQPQQRAQPQMNRPAPQMQRAEPQSRPAPAAEHGEPGRR